MIPQKKTGTVRRKAAKHTEHRCNLRALEISEENAQPTENRDQLQHQQHKPLSPLDIESKVFAKRINIAFYKYFTFHLTKHQHGFVKHGYVLSDKLFILKKTHEALDSKSNSENVAFNTDFSKAADKVPHYELIQKVAQIRVGGCLLEILINYLETCK